METCWKVCISKCRSHLWQLSNCCILLTRVLVRIYQVGYVLNLRKRMLRGMDASLVFVNSELGRLINTSQIEDLSESS